MGASDAARMGASDAAHGPAAAAAAAAAAGPGPAPGPGATPDATKLHKRVPRWLRVSLRVSILVAAVSLPALAIKDKRFTRLNERYSNYSMLFLLLGTLVLPLWEPNLGNIALCFTLLIPLAWIALWLAYGLFLACSNVVFVMAVCVLVTFVTFFVCELLSLPLGLLSVFVTLFVAASNTFLSAPRAALQLTTTLSIMLVVAAVLSVVVCWLIFPEFCVDEVFRYHHEGLEHLLHLAHHALGRAAPRLLSRVFTSSAAEFGSGGNYKWQQVFAAADDTRFAGAGGDALAAGRGELAPMPSGTWQPGKQLRRLTGGGDGSQLGASQKLQRSWHRIFLSLDAGAKAQLGAKAEVVLVAAAHKRVIVPCVPLLSIFCTKGQMSDAGLLALRHSVVATALQVVNLWSATHPLDPATAQLMHRMLSSAEWEQLGGSLLAALQELVSAFPQDYYPSRPPDPRHLAVFQADVDRLCEWRSRHAEHGVDTGGAAALGEGPAAPNGSHSVAIPPEAAAAAAGSGGDNGVGDSEQDQQQHQQQEQLLRDVFQHPLLSVSSEHPAAAGAAARLNVLVIVRMLEELSELLEQLYSAAGAASSGLVRFKCCG